MSLLWLMCSEWTEESNFWCSGTGVAHRPRNCVLFMFSRQQNVREPPVTNGSFRSSCRRNFFPTRHVLCCSLSLGIKLGKLSFSTETWSKTREFSRCWRKEAAACSGSSDNCSLTDLLLMAVSEEGRGRMLLQWWQHQVQLFCILLSKDLISDREKHPVSLICFDWQWIPIL